MITVQGVIVVATIIVTTVGILAAVWSFVATRRRFYKDYLRKRHD